jgi:hypothetical protein
MEGWCEMRKDEHFSQLLLEMTTDEDYFALFSRSTPPEIDANNNKHDEWLTIFSIEELESIAAAVCYLHENSSELIKVNICRILCTLFFVFAFAFCFSPMVL